MLTLVFLFCLLLTPSLGLDEWIPITESPDVTETEPKWSEDCTADLEKVFMGKESIYLNDDLSIEGKKMAGDVLRARSCDVVTGDNVAFCTFSEKIFRGGCSRAIKGFKESLKKVQDGILGCGFISRKLRGFSMVCLKNTQDPEIILQQSVRKSCEDEIWRLYRNDKVTRNVHLEQIAEKMSREAMKSTCKDNEVEANVNRCRVIKNTRNDNASGQCETFINGISGEIKRDIGCKFVPDGAKAALTCIFQKN